MASDDVQLLKERVNLRTLVIALGVVVCGIGLLYVSGRGDLLKDHQAIATVFRDLGSLLVVTVAITVFWELWGKRALLDEVLAKAQLSKEISFAGIVKITEDFYHGIDWPGYLQRVNKLDIFFAYGQTWRNSHPHEFRELGARPGVRIRVVLPDPNDGPTMIELARRFQSTPENLRRLVREAAQYFFGLRPGSGAEGATVNIWYLPAAPLYSSYRFDDVAIVTLYNHRRGRAGVPSFVCESGGTVYTFLRDEFESMIKEPDGLARRAAPDGAH